MIDHVLTFLKDQLNSYLKVKTGVDGFEVTFVQDRTQREITFPKEALTAILVNIEEERTFRSGGSYPREITTQRSEQTVQPFLCLNVYVLFVANFTNYSQSLKLLSLVISFFHSHRFFNAQNSPDLSSEIEKLTLELVNLPFEEQKDIWGLLGNSYLPSALYKVRMVIFENLDDLEIGTPVTKVEALASPV